MVKLMSEINASVAIWHLMLSISALVPQSTTLHTISLGIICKRVDISHVRHLRSLTNDKAQEPEPVGRRDPYFEPACGSADALSREFA